MLGAALLNEIIKEENCTSPGEILDELRDKVKTSLKQTGKQDENKDGMDMTLYTVDTTNNILYFAGAHNSLYIIRQKDKSVSVADLPASETQKEN